MRISGRGAGSSGSGGGDKQRAASFKRRHRVGERVSGRLIKWVDHNLAWVLINGHELLARIGSRPEPGQMLFFYIEKLEPQIVLKEMTGPPSGGLELTQSIHSFWTSRATFESYLTKLFSGAGGQGSQDGQDGFDGQPNLDDGLDQRQRKALLLDAVNADNQAMAMYLDIQAHICDINARLEPQRFGKYYYLPWLLPAAAQQEALITTAPETPRTREIIFSFQCPLIGRAQARALVHDNQARCRLLLDNSRFMKPIASMMRAVFSGLPPLQALDIEFLGAGPLPPGDLGALDSVIVSSMDSSLGPAGQSYSGINTIV